MSAITSSFQNFFSHPCETIKDCVQTRVYSVKKAFSKCWNSDFKVHTFLILGRVLQAIGVATSLVTLAYTFISSPVSLLAIVPSVATYALGHFLVENNQIDTGVIETEDADSDEEEFVPGKPVGLRNTTNNCWINSFLQCVMHIPVLQEAARAVPELGSYVSKYVKQQNKAKASSEFNWSKLNAQLVKVVRRRGRNELSLGGQADASTLFEWLFNASGSMYQMRQTVGETSRTQIAVDMLRLEMDPDGPNNVSELLDTCFDYYTAEGVHCKKEFSDAPDTLVCQLQRFCYKEDEETGEQRRVHIKRSVSGLDEVITLDASKLVDGGSAEYACEAFIVHKGSFKGGHYIAYIKKDGQWWRCDDSEITAVSDRNAHRMMRHCYLFFLNKQA
jgi:hypothetical protein